MALQTRSGLIGISMWRTRRWESASITAFWTAGPAPIVPPSPTPFAPNGFRSVGVASATVTNAGNSAALGIAYVARLDVHGLPNSAYTKDSHSAWAAPFALP